MMLKDTEEPSPLSNFVTNRFIALLLLKPLKLSYCFLDFKKTIPFFSEAFPENRPCIHKILFGKNLGTVNFNVEQYLV
ncbi:hypothetical protein DUE52_13050 [Larkinella punicea]|uniref:Uncharacterized protein n=1 Tax=Larkinella punicea TaxID=2315727 RepID=A0A368JQL9_9BACT|nr:hypothetical protein DUE52_13050 [Larkinella punicea]